MSIPNSRVMKRRPTQPGEMWREDFMPDYALTVAGLAEALGVSRQSINELLRERRALSPGMALRLSRLFGNAPESGSTHSAALICGRLVKRSRTMWRGSSLCALYAFGCK